MSDIEKNKHESSSFRVRVQFPPNTFADELDKRNFLETVLRELEQTGIGLLAFVLLDDEFAAVLITGDGKKKEMDPDEQAETEWKMVNSCCETDEREIREKLRRCIMVWHRQNTTEHQSEDEDAIITDIRCMRIEQPQEIVQNCVRLHLRPVEEGYVLTAGDYWWSSLQSYRNSYSWPGVAVEELLLLLSDDPKKGYYQFLRMHRERIPK